MTICKVGTSSYFKKVDVTVGAPDLQGRYVVLSAR